MLAFSFFPIYIFIADNISISMYIMCVKLFLFSKVGTLQISIIIINMGGSESHFTVSLIAAQCKVVKMVSVKHSFRRERRAGAESNRHPSAYQPYALPPGQTSSH